MTTEAKAIGRGERDGAEARPIPPSRRRHLRGDGRPGRGWRYHLWCFVRQWPVTHALWAGLALLSLYLAATGREGPVWIAASALGLALLPAAIEGLTQIRLPRGLVLAVTVFVCLTIVGGELWDLYQRAAWWDVAMHLMSGAAVAGIGLAGALTLLGPARRRIGPTLPLLFAWFTSVAVAGLWELFEFSLDAGYGFSTQPSLADTMHDLGWATLGAGLVTILGALHLSDRPTGPFGRWIEGAARENAHLVRGDAG